MNRKYLFMFLVGLAVTVFFTYPFILYLKKNNGSSLDLMFLDWLFQYNYRAITTGSIFNIGSYFNSNQFYPFSHTLALADVLLLPSSVIYTPLMIITKDSVLSLNGLIFLSLFLSFISAFFCIDFLIKNKISAFFAAIIYTFSPVAFARFPAHIEYLQKYLIPPLFLLAILFFEKPNFKRGFALITVYFLSWLTSIQLTIFSSLFIFLLSLYYFYIKYRVGKLLNWLKSITFGSLIGIPFLLILISLYWPYWQFSVKENYVRDLAENSHNAARWEDFFIGSPNQLLLGNIYKKLEKTRIKNGDTSFNYSEHTLTPGIIASALFFIYLIKHKNGKFSNLFLFFIFCGIVLSFGPMITLGGRETKLPYYYIYQYVPLFGAIRTPTRLWLVVIYFFSIIVGLGIRDIIRKQTIFSSVFLILLFLSLFLEYKQNIIVDTKKPNFSLKNLQQKKVLFFPFSNPDTLHRSAYYLVNSIKGDFTMVNGFIGTDYESHYRLREELKKDSFSLRWLEIIKTLGIERVVIDKQKLYPSDSTDNPLIQRLSDKDFNGLISYENEEWTVINLEKFTPKHCISDDLSNLNIKYNLADKNLQNNGKIIDLIFTNFSNCNLRLLFDKNYIPVKYKIDSADKKQAGLFYVKLPYFLLKNESITIQKQLQVKVNYTDDILLQLFRENSN